jgi:hypothetical protein
MARLAWGRFIGNDFLEYKENAFQTQPQVSTSQRLSAIFEIAHCSLSSYSAM